MTDCPSLAPDSTSGIADALKAVDCVSANAAGTAFGRLFGPSGHLGVALTLILTLYVALLAINLLTGRSRIGLNMLTPRMLALGMVLTFATSWIAYQNVVWTLLTGAPDEIASVVTGDRGSATATFAGRLDQVFTAVSNAAETANTPAPVSQVTGITAAPAQVAGWTAGDVLWMAALLLLLGTVGVLLVARIALAALLAIGPVFIVFALFRGTFGLFVGWLKGAVMFAIVPLFTVLIGGAALALLAPIVSELDTGAVTMRLSVTMLLGAAVYIALMVIVVKVSGTIVGGWRIGGRGADGQGSDARDRSVAAAAGAAVAAADAAASAGPSAASSTPFVSDRVRSIVEASRAPANDVDAPSIGDRRTPALAAATRPYSGDAAPSISSAGDRRIQGVGAQFRSPAARPSRKPA